VSEGDFWEGHDSPSKIVNFRRRIVKEDGGMVPSRLVEIKFQSSVLPNKISIYKVLYEVKTSIRSPI